MNIEEMIIKAIWTKACSGYRKLQDNEGRYSLSGECSYYLYFEKIYPLPAPDPEKPVFMKAPNDSITVKNAKGVMGDYIHDGIEAYLHGIHADCERETKFMNDKILLTGKIDINYFDDSDGHNKVADIKTVGYFVFPYVTGEKESQNTTYSSQKRQLSIIQANNYAFTENCPWFCIVWIDRDSGKFKIEPFKTDQKVFENTVNKFEDVFTCVALYRETKQINYPLFSGISLCELGKDQNESYCPHHKFGTTGDFHEQSSANCPGRIALESQKAIDKRFEKISGKPVVNKNNKPEFKDIVNQYTENRNDDWYCKLCNKPISQVTRFKEGYLTAHHLWYDHGIRDFRTDNIGGKQLT